MQTQPQGWPEPNLTPNGVKVLEKRYLKRTENELLETPGGRFYNVARTIAEAYPEHLRDQYTWQFYEMMANCEFLPNSPTLMNAGRGNGLQYAACFVLRIEDSMESIFEIVKRTALIHQSGGGTGFDFSRLRPKGDFVKTTGGIASGPVSFMKVINEATEEVKQGGNRRGANMGILRVDHPDILEFITCKSVLSGRNQTIFDQASTHLTEKGKNILHASLLEGQNANFNVSVAITEEFMQALCERKSYSLKHPRTGATVANLDATEVWKLLVRSAWFSGDPGLIFIDRINTSASNPVPCIGPVESTNPCVTGDTRLATSRGLIRVDELYKTQEPLMVVSDRRGEFVNASGVQILPAVPVFKTSNHERVFKVITKAGYELKATRYHEMITPGGRVQVKDLKVGDTLFIQSGEGCFGNQGSRELGLVLGSLTGDGHFSENRATLSFWGKNTEYVEEIHSAVSNLVEDVPTLGSRKYYGVSVVQIPVSQRQNISSVRLARLLKDYGVTKETKLRVPEVIWQGSRETVVAYLQALFEADGTVNLDIDHSSCNIRLSQSNESLLKEIQQLLANFGIFSRIYSRRKASFKSMPDGRGSSKNYWCKDQYELVISGASRNIFASEIGFLSKVKQEKLVKADVGAYSTKYETTVVSIEPLGYEPVYDTTEPKTHSLIFGGISTANCGEVPLYPNEACNLGSINLAKFIKGQEINWDRLAQVVRLGTYFLDGVISVNPYPDALINQAVKENRRIGLGVMGWADLLIQLEIPYDSAEAARLGSRVMQFVNKTAQEASEELADNYGAFPNWHQSIYRDANPRRNSTVTCIAPTGTISIIAGCSSGIEPLFALCFDRAGSLDGKLDIEFYKSFEEVAKREGFWSDKLGRRLLYAGSVSHIESVPDKWRTVFSTAHDVSLAGHIRMQSAFQEHVENAVSKTINLTKDASVEDVEKAYMMAYENGCKGITVYRDQSKSGVLHIGTQSLCPDCGHDLIQEEGCQTCSNQECGWSACSIG